VRARIAAEPCLACESAPALPCPAHVAEMDLVSLYRTLARDLRIVLMPT
jgi:hypothetical protein